MTEVTLNTRAVEQWFLSADTSATFFGTGTGTTTTIPFATRDTQFPDLGNSISSGVLTLGAAVKADYKACRVDLHAVLASTLANDDWFDILMYKNSRASAPYVHIGTLWYAGSHLSMQTPWFDHTGFTNLELTVRGENTFGMLKGANPPVDATVMTLEFR